MPKPKIDRVQLDQMLRHNKSQREIAQFFGVTDGAISKAKNELNVAVIKNVALESAHRVVDRHLDTVEQLRKVNDRANMILDTLTESCINEKLDSVLSALALSKNKEIRKVKEKVQGLVREIFADQTTALRACAEIRQQLELQLEVLRTLYDLQEVESFQREVLDAIESASPELKKTIVRRLKERRALRPSAVFSGS